MHLVPFDDGGIWERQFGGSRALLKMEDIRKYGKRRSRGNRHVGSA